MLLYECSMLPRKWIIQYCCHGSTVKCQSYILWCDMNMLKHMPTVGVFLWKIPTLARHTQGLYTWTTLQAVCSFALFAAKLIKCRGSLMPGACRMENRNCRVLQWEEQRKESRKWHGKREYFFVQAILGVQSVKVRNGCRAFVYESRQDDNVFS